jgi:integrase
MIQKRQTKRRTVYDVRIRRPDGREYSRTFDTKKEAVAFEARERAARSRGDWIDPERSRKITVAEWANEWRMLHDTKAPTTKELDRAVVEGHLVPRFGAQSIGSVRPLDIQRMVAEWNRKYAASTVRRYYGVVRAIFNAAVSADVIGRTPCRGVRLPEVEETSHTILEPEELHRLAAQLPSRYRLMAYLGAILGLRFEEVAGLRRSSIDLADATVSITQTVTTAGGQVYIGPPKTAAGRRTLAIPEGLVRMLHEHLGKFGPGESDGDALIFSDSQGGPLRYSNFLRRVWAPARTSADLSAVGFHDLRRTAITAMVAAGVDVRTAQARAGHADPRMTLSVYAKATRPADRQAADAVGDHFLP